MGPCPILRGAQGNSESHDHRPEREPQLAHPAPYIRQLFLLLRRQCVLDAHLDALWKSDAEMRKQFEAWTGMIADESRDPYASLPPVEISGVVQDVHEGTGAMRAYQEMMYGADKKDPEKKEMWAGLLQRYCELDTLSMVLILEHWRRCVGLA